MAKADDIRGLVAQLRAEGRALEGKVGNLKSAYKKIARQLEDFAGELEKAPEAVKEAGPVNPNCFGTGAEGDANVAGCECRTIFSTSSLVGKALG